MGLNPTFDRHYSHAILEIRKIFVIAVVFYAPSAMFAPPHGLFSSNSKQLGMSNVSGARVMLA